MFAYEQCLLCLGHHPDIWYEAATYLEESSKILTEKGVCTYILSIIKFHGACYRKLYKYFFKFVYLKYTHFGLFHKLGKCV